jgi:hypothetical protein
MEQRTYCRYGKGAKVMTKKEFGKIAMALKTYYPRESLLPNDEALELWYRQLCDLQYSVAEAALNKWVATSKWSPTVADLRKNAIEIKLGNQQDWGEGWERVLKAIRKYGTYDGKRALEELDEISRECVKRLGWYNLCMSEHMTTDRANFRMIYEELAERRKEQAQLPEQLRTQIDAIQQVNVGMIEGSKSE